MRIEGIVQGVGFRPFVHTLAARSGLSGFVGNDGRGVYLEVEGGAAAIDTFRTALTAQPPPLAVIEHLTDEPLEPIGDTGFRIVGSAHGGARQALVSPDTATCADCLRELLDPADRRYGYPFINCTNCGPRFTIIRSVPYDRPATTMAGFAMCARCRREYEDPSDRRFHAQPVCCADCGPATRLMDAAGHQVAGDPITVAAELIRAGHVVAVKGLGGYHLAVDATAQRPVAALRAGKHREDKPFAVMARDLAAARELCAVDETETALLTGPARPIVLLARHPGADLADAVAPGDSHLGVMLPYTPLHHLLARALAGPFVLTSGNVSNEPIAYRDEDAFARLRGIAGYFLIHDRPIHVRADDSVTRAFRGTEMVLRRSRGHAPRPLRIAAAPRQVLGCGAELKNTFCLVKGERAFVSPHIGDLENHRTLRSYAAGIAHVAELFDVRPQVVAHDLHPEYLSTKYARDLDGVELVGVQHHHAHIAACLADNGCAGPVIGVAFDGTGYGTDGTIWGGEFLLADLTGFERLGHLEPVPLPGGAAAIREPWRMAAAYLHALGDDAADLAVTRRNEARWDAVVAMARSGLNAPATSSAGRLFDAVAAITGVRDAVRYEGQAAIEFERLVDPTARGRYPVRVGSGSPVLLHGGDLVAAVAADVRGGVDPGVIAARFHRGLASAVAEVCRVLRERTGVAAVALSGGVFQNIRLLTDVATLLEGAGFTPLIHHRVPANDGGISLGQAAVAAALDRADGPGGARSPSSANR